MKKVENSKIHVFGIDTDLDRLALDADPDPDPQNWSQLKQSLCKIP
jgi:hypothetical protein